MTEPLEAQTPDKLIARRIELKNHIDAQQKKFTEFMKPFQSEVSDIDNALLAMMNASRINTIKTDAGTAYLSTIVTPKVDNRSSYLEWLWSLDDTQWQSYGDAMLQVAAPQKDALTEYQESHEGQLPPGVTTSAFTRVNVRRS